MYEISVTHSWFGLRHNDTSFRNDSILPVAGSSTVSGKSYQKVIIYEVSAQTKSVQKLNIPGP